MAKKPISKPISKPVSKAPVSSPVRNSAVPKAQAVSARPTREQIAMRAYEIYASGKGGSEMDNWHRAERELRAGK